jgi:hypothetical protein
LTLATFLMLQITMHVRAQGVELCDGVAITAEVVASDRVDRTLALLAPAILSHRFLPCPALL